MHASRAGTSAQYPSTSVRKHWLTARRVSSENSRFESTSVSNRLSRGEIPVYQCIMWASWILCPPRTSFSRRLQCRMGSRPYGARADGSHRRSPSGRTRCRQPGRWVDFSPPSIGEAQTFGPRSPDKVGPPVRKGGWRGSRPFGICAWSHRAGIRRCKQRDRSY